MCCLFLFSTSLQAQTSIVVDGNNCNNEWSATANAIDGVDPVGTPGTSDLRRFWIQSYGDTIYMAFTRGVPLTGNAGFTIYLNTDSNSTTGHTGFGGADAALFLVVGSNTITGSNIYKWNSTSNKMSSTGVSVNAALGDSSCTDTLKTFFEMAVGMTDMFDPCGLMPSGYIEVTDVVSHSGQSFTSRLVDTLHVYSAQFMNAIPHAMSSSMNYEVCSGGEVTFDASVSSSNATGYSSSDSIVSYAWDLNYNGTFSADTQGMTYTQTYTAGSGSQTYNNALVVTDAFGCTDTITDIIVTVYANPVLIPEVTIDSNFTTCAEYEFNHSIVSAFDHSGNPLAGFMWAFPDGDSAAGSNVTHIYDQCFWSIPGDLTLYVTGTDSNGCSTTVPIVAPVPVEMISFNARRSNDVVVLEWKTATEINNDRFEVERSFDGMSFEYIGEVRGAGTTLQIQNYEFFDRSVTDERVYYRLKQIDFDGAHEYSAVLAVNGSAEGMDVKIYPNPAVSHVTINLGNNSEDRTVSVVDIAGKQVMTRSGNFEKLTLPVNELERGVYTILIVSRNAVVSHKIILK